MTSNKLPSKLSKLTYLTLITGLGLGLTAAAAQDPKPQPKPKAPLSAEAQEEKTRLSAIEKAVILSANAAQTNLAEYYKSQVTLQKAQQEAKDARDILRAEIIKSEKKLGCPLDDNFECTAAKSAPKSKGETAPQ